MDKQPSIKNFMIPSEPAPVSTNSGHTDINQNKQTLASELASPVDSASVSKTSKKKPYSSEVWKYFKKSQADGKSYCNICNKPYYSNATNLKRHLKNCNAEIYKTVDESDDAAAFKDGHKEKQTKMTPSSFASSYQYNDPKQKLFRHKLAYLAAGTTISSTVLQSEEFKDCIRVADRKLRVPCKITIEKDVKELGIYCRKKVKEIIKPVGRMTILSDIWTKKGQASSYLGVMAVFYHPDQKKKMQVLLGIQKFTTVRHTALDVIREMQVVTDRYDIRPKQVWRAMTDGGSNMIASHRQDAKIFARYSREESSGTICTYNESDSDIDVLETTECENYNSSSDANACEESFETNTMTETYRRLTCFIHTLLRCLSVEEELEIQALVLRVKSVVGKFKKSHVLTEALVNEAGIGLISCPETRWNYIYHVFSRLLQVKANVIAVLKSFKKDKYIFCEQEWTNVQQLADFLEPFKKHTNMSSKERQAISSEVVVTVIELYNHLDKYDSNPFLGSYSRNIKMRMKEKFSHWFHDSNQTPLEGTYIASTLLDPRYRFVLPQEKQALAKSFLIREYASYLQETQNECQEVFSEPMREETPTSSHSRFPFLLEIRASHRREKVQSGSKLELFKAELQTYLENACFDEFDESLDVFDFWLKREVEFQLLTPVALDYLSLPSSTSNVECTFSLAGVLTQGGKHRLDGENLEDKIIIHKNRKLLQEQ